MRKIVSFIPAMVMFIILAVLFFFMCLPQNQSRVKAQNGLLDLRGETNTAPLHGEWEFIYGELLTPGEFAERQPATITVPSSWDEYDYPLNGCATYRLTVLTDNQEPLMLYLPEIYSSYTLYINGELVRTAGVASENPAEGQLLFENALITLRAENDVIDLVVQVSNYHENYGGITGSLLLGETVAVQSWFFQTRLFAAIVLGCILMAAFYHLTLYIYRRREKAYLMFSVLCFTCFGRFLMETNSLNAFFQWIPENVYWLKFYYALTYLHVMIIVIFVIYTFDIDFFRKYRCRFIGGCVLFFLINILMPANTSVSVLVIAVTGLPFQLLSVIVPARSAAMKENSTMRWYFAAVLIYLFIGFTSKIFLDNTLFMTGLITNIFMIMVQSMVLSRRYTDAFRFVEETNENLELIVNERTNSLQTANEAMQITNNAMKELVSNISHDLKTPLAVMSVNLESLSELAATQSDADYQRYVRAAYQKNLDLQRLIQNLFEVSRIETGRGLYAPKWESLLRLLAKVKEKYDDYMEDHSLSFDIDTADDIEISTDPLKIWSVFDNIIYNAVRHTDSGGITITARKDGSSATVTITDTGCGIEPQHLPHVFDRFYKGSQARSTIDGESGLGLYIVKSVMEGCGGSADIQSEPGKGTSVILTFPVSLRV